MAKTTTIKTASVLAFERKLANSDAVLSAGNWQEECWVPVKIQEKAVRGTISNRLKNALSSDPAKLDAEIQKANLQRVDVAALPADCDTLKMTFSLRILGNLATPSVCNDRVYQDVLASTINGYIEEQGFGELAVRYATNLANGRALWRNRVGAEHLRVVVNGSQRWEFNAHDYALRDFAHRDESLMTLAAEIERGLTGETFVLLDVEIYARLGRGQEVFPSQELILDSNSTKSKVLYQVDGVAALHSQKVGNALRTIDTWHPQADSLGAIAVEPYGSVTSRGIACRQPKEKMDFYTLLDNWVTKGDKPSPEQQHFVMAVLIRGGVFGEKSE